MKYTVKMSCGHEEVIDLVGKDSDRERKIKGYETNGLCRECRKKKMEEKEKNMPLSFNVMVLPYVNNYNGNILLDAWFDGDAEPYKDTLKSLGYTCGRKASAAADFSGRPSVCYNKRINLDELSQEIKKAKAIGAKILTSETEMYTTPYYKRALTNKKAWDERQSKISHKIEQLEKPIVPESVRERKWNQKVYGRQGHYSIYPDGEKVEISDEEATALEEYLKKKEEYCRKVRDIKHG